MDPELTGDQELLLQTSTRFIESTYPLSALRSGIGTADAGSDYRRKAAELGWYAMLVPEHHGGGSLSGNGMLDAAVVAYARGGLLQPGTFVDTNVVALALAEAGTERQQAEVLPALLSGEAAAAWAFSAPGGASDPTGGVTARPAGERRWVLSGAKTLVHDADRCEWLLVTGQSPDGPVQVLLDPAGAGITVRPLDGLDLTRRFCEVRFADVAVPDDAVVGSPARTAEVLERQLQAACVLTVAESVGAMDHDFEMALQYAKDRTAFGRPIGSFQAVKHLLADTSLLLEMSKGLAVAAARAVGAARADAGELASAAKAFVGDCGIDVAQQCFQVFGGIGYTWDHDQHLYLRRLTTDATRFGDPSWHRERICRLGGL